MIPKLPEKLYFLYDHPKDDPFAFFTDVEKVNRIMQAPNGDNIIVQEITTWGGMNIITRAILDQDMWLKRTMG